MSAQYGVFEDDDVIETGFWGDTGQVAARVAAAAYIAEDPERFAGMYTVKEMCSYHEEQPKDGCEECAAEWEEESDEPDNED
jgi:hypothetical protein